MYVTVDSDVDGKMLGARLRWLDDRLRKRKTKDHLLFCYQRLTAYMCELDVFTCESVIGPLNLRLLASLSCGHDTDSYPTER
jgi:hypothetical protein